MPRTSFAIGVVIERRVLTNRWQSVQWAPVAVEPAADEVAPARIIYEDAHCQRWLYAGLDLRLYPDEAEGYFLNCSTAEPVIFVAWRMEDEMAVPWMVTASYNEASRLLDSGEEMQGVPIPDEILKDVSAFVSEHYKPEPKKRIRPPSFKGARRDE